MAVRIFLSLVGAEFREYRDQLRYDLTRHNVEVKVEEDFKDYGNTTLDKLDLYIANCDAVVHLVGDMIGAIPDEGQRQALQRKHEDLPTRLPPLADALRSGTEISYTQWEAWLALYHDKLLLIAKADDSAPRGPNYQPTDASRAAQRAHLHRLAAVERYPGGIFKNPDNLAKQILSGVIIDLLARSYVTSYERLPAEQYERLPAKQYCVSYAWDDDTPGGADREAVVERLCREAERRGIHVMRDKTDMGLGDSINSFMSRIAEGDRVFIILSEKYLHSTYCMMELYRIWMNCMGKEKTFFNRVRVFSLPDVKMSDFKQRAEYRRYWEDELSARKPYTATMSTSEFQEYRSIEQLISFIPEILSLIQDRLRPKNFDDLERYFFN